MGDPAPGRPAVEPPPGCVGRGRRHRPLVGLSGLVLFACMFLPAVNGCHDPVVPFEVPPFWPPYLYGGVFALLALWRTARGVHLGVLALRALAALIVLGSILVVLMAPPIGIIEMMLGTVLLAIVGLAGTTEARIAGTGVAVGAVCTLWFGVWAITPDALLGVHLSLAASLGLLAGSVAWLRGAVRSPQVDMPRAVTVVRPRR
jgi:hypothetical protein